MLSLKLPQLLRVHQVPRVRGYTLQHRLPQGLTGAEALLAPREAPPAG